MINSNRSKTSIVFLAGILSSLLLVVPLQAQDLVRVYPAPAGEPLSNLFKVAVEGQPSSVYLAHVVSMTGANLKEYLTGKASFTSFDISGPVKVTVTYAQPIQEVKLLPSRWGIATTVSGNQVTFVIPRPGQFTVEINGDWENSLHLFANPFEKDIPNPNDPNVIYFGPGIHQVKQVKVNSDQTVYIAGGAVVYGQFVPGETKNGDAIFKCNGSHFTIRGRGIIDGSAIPKEYDGEKVGGHLIYARGSHIRVEGVILRDSGSWTLYIDQAHDVEIKNIKVLGWRENSDGTDINNSQDVVVSDSFYRTNDDLVVIKSQHIDAPETSNVTVKGCVLWNVRAHALTLGTELRANINGVDFSDSDIIHDKGHDQLLAINDYYEADVQNITFENIRIQESMWLIYLKTGPKKKGKHGMKGHIESVTFRNIVAATPSRPGPNISLKGYSPSNEIDGVTFDHVTIGGAPLQSSDIESNQYVGNVAVTP